MGEKFLQPFFEGQTPTASLTEVKNLEHKFEELVKTLNLEYFEEVKVTKINGAGTLTKTTGFRPIKKGRGPGKKNKS
jgi:hypothetical protein